MIVYRGVDASSSLEERERLLLEWEQGTSSRSVFLSTCDRVEIYDGEGVPESQTLEHLFRVVSGLESPLLGENQIQSQVKAAYEEARLRTKLPAGLHKMFQTALRVGKRVRTETNLSRGAVGHAQIVTKLLELEGNLVSQLRLVVIGVNKQTLGILRFLKEKGNTSFSLVNRTLEKAIQVCQELNAGTAHPLTVLPELLPSCDVLITATSSPEFLVFPEHFAGGLMSPLIFDLAVPRDVDPRVAHLSGVRLFNVTDLEKEAERTLESRAGEIAAAEVIIHAEVEKFLQSSNLLAHR